MAIASILSRAQNGIDAPQVRVEVHVSNGLAAFSLVGLPETVVKESKDRVRAAITNSNFAFPNGRITVNLAPADLPKEGGRFDLPIAIGILIASDQLRVQETSPCEFYGELSLSGELRPVRGALPAALHAHQTGNAIVLPRANGMEASLVSGVSVATADHLLEVCHHLEGTRRLEFQPSGIDRTPKRPHADLADVKGQAFAKRALEIAAVGEHSLLMIGPPGTGKSMIAQRLPGILPPMTEIEALETAAVRSICGRGGLKLSEWRVRPFRNPHHTASAVALVGGGSHPRPGEISLAHNGVLFLDELPEFERRVLEVLREPLETGVVTVSRAARQAEFPARFQLVAAMNPCPCGYSGDQTGKCRCTLEHIQRYRARISGPLLDRLDLHVEVPRVSSEELAAVGAAESSATIERRVAKARELQLGRQGKSNARLTNVEVDRHCAPDTHGRAMLERAMQKFGLSARAYHRILKVARSIADIEQSAQVQVQHVTEAINLRRLDRAK